MTRPWLAQYPAGVPAEIDPSAYPSLVALMEESFRKYRDLPAYKFMGRTITFGEVDELSKAFAAWLQGQGLQHGDRVAIMMPNVPQYPVAVAGILRAGYVVVNVNPLYTPRELEHQLKDSGAKAIVILENFATTFEEVRAIDAVARSLPESTAKNVGLLAAEPAAAAVQAFLKLQTPLDKLEVRGRDLYWLSQVKQSESALFKVDFERVLQVPLTMRGASTIEKLCAKYPA